MLESQQGMSQSGNIHFLWILPKFSHSSQPQLQMIQPIKHCTKAALLAVSSSQLRCWLHLPIQKFWNFFRGRVSFKPRKIWIGNVVFWRKAQEDVKAKDKFLSFFRWGFRSTLFWRSGLTEMIFATGVFQYHGLRILWFTSTQTKATPEVWCIKDELVC